MLFLLIKNTDVQKHLCTHVHKHTVLLEIDRDADYNNVPGLAPGLSDSMRQTIALIPLFIFGCSSSDVHEVEPWPIESAPARYSGILMNHGFRNEYYPFNRVTNYRKTTFYPVDFEGFSPLSCEAWTKTIQQSKGYTLPFDWSDILTPRRPFFELRTDEAQSTQTQNMVVYYADVIATTKGDEMTLEQITLDTCKTAQITQGCTLPRINDFCVIEGNSQPKPQQSAGAQTTDHSVSIEMPTNTTGLRRVVLEKTPRFTPSGGLLFWAELGQFNVLSVAPETTNLKK